MPESEVEPIRQDFGKTGFFVAWLKQTTIGGLLLAILTCKYRGSGKQGKCLWFQAVLNLTLKMKKGTFKRLPIFVILGNYLAFKQQLERALRRAEFKSKPKQLCQRAIIISRLTELIRFWLDSRGNK